MGPDATAVDLILSSLQNYACSRPVVSHKKCNAKLFTVDEAVYDDQICQNGKKG